MSQYYEFYKIYRTSGQDVEAWQGKPVEELPEHLQFFSKESEYDDRNCETEEIQKYLRPIVMEEDGKNLRGYLGTLYPVVIFGKGAYEIEYKMRKSGCGRIVQLTDSEARRMIKYAFRACKDYYDLPEEELEGILGKKNAYKHYPGKLRHIVYTVDY